MVVLYLLANVAYLAVLPFPEIQHAPQNRVAVAMMNALFGRPGAMCMAAAIMISTFGCDNGLILAGARVYYAMARDGLFFRKIATTNRFRVPAAALVAQGIWTACLVLPRTVTINAATHEASYGNVYNQLLEYIVSADLVFYLLMIVALILLRRQKPDAERPYRTWGYPIVPIVSIVLSALLVIDLAWLAPATSGIGISNRVEWCAGLFLVAAASRGVSLSPRSHAVAVQSILPAGNELFLYACKIKETTNGCRRCSRCKTW